ncbi:MAG TPA: DUF5667 domain-containing protein [Candidatus Parcubacteria bacterium]|nr:DUF5667 domain-containing protein [Candidatus Parcubacteria bacterium]
MTYLVKFSIILIISLLGLTFISGVLAQETPSPDITEIINLDENITSEDLEVGTPRILPDSPFYFVKNLSRGIRSLLTYNPVAKIELKQQFADEKLIEVKELAEARPEKKEALKKAFESYRLEVEQLKVVAENITENVENPRIDKFLDKFIDRQLKHQRLLGMLETKLPPEVYEKIEEVKEENLAKFSDIGLKFADPLIFKEKIEKISEEQSGSQFKHFKNLEILIALEDKVSDQAKEAIQSAQKNSLKRLKENLEGMSLEDQEKFKDYINNIGGNEVRHIEVIHELEGENIKADVRKTIENSKEKVVQRIETRLSVFEKGEITKGREALLGHLENGEMKDLRIIKELENSLPPQTIDKILTVKYRAMDNFRKDFESADTVKEREKFLKPLEKLHDVKQFEIFEEIEEIISDDKKGFLEQLKEKTLTEMRIEVNGAESSKMRTRIYEKLAGDSPEQIEVIRKYIPQSDLREGIIVKQVEKLKIRIENIENPIRLEIIRKKVDEGGIIKQEVIRLQPKFFQKVEEKQDMFSEKITPERVKEMIEKVKHLINQAKEELNKIDDETRKVSANKLLESALEHQRRAIKALNEEETGEAFGQATSALYNAENAIRIIRKTEIKTNIMESRIIEPSVSQEMPTIEKPLIRELCIQVITPAINSDGICKKFSTPCDVPDDWKKVDSCPTTTSEPKTEEGVLSPIFRKIESVLPLKVEDSSVESVEKIEVQDVKTLDK